MIILAGSPLSGPKGLTGHLSSRGCKSKFKFSCLESALVRLYEHLNRSRPRKKKKMRNYFINLMRNFLQKIGVAKRLWYEYRIRRCPPVFVYSMGKVGSKALRSGLFQWWPGLVLHEHHLWDRFDDPLIRAVERSCFGGRCPIYLISPVREPVARNVSAFFETYEWYFGTPITESGETIPELQETFLSEYRHNIPLVWFDERLRPLTDIDVYEDSFPVRGYQQYSHENVHLLVMRTNLENEKKSEVVADFLPDQGRSTPRIERKNAAEDKPYQKIYKQFKNNFEPPEWYIEYMYNSRCVLHFFGSEDRTAFREKWGAEMKVSPQ